MERNQGFRGSSDEGKKYELESVYDEKILQDYEDLSNKAANDEFDFNQYVLDVETDPGETGVQSSASERIKTLRDNVSISRKDLDNFVHIKGDENEGRDRSASLVLPENESQSSVLVEDGIAEFEKRDLAAEILAGLEKYKNQAGELDFENLESLKAAVAELGIFDDIKKYSDNTKDVVSTQNPYLGVTSYKTWVPLSGVKLNGVQVDAQVQVSFGARHNKIFFRDLKVE